MFVTHRELKSNTLNALKHTWTQILLRHPAAGKADHFCFQLIIDVCLTSLNLLCVFKIYNGSFSAPLLALIRPGFTIRPEWCDHKWTASSPGVNTPETTEDTLEIRLLSPHSEVVLAEEEQKKIQPLNYWRQYHRAPFTNHAILRVFMWGETWLSLPYL